MEVLGKKSHKVSCNREKGVINSDSGLLPTGSDSGRVMKDERLTVLPKVTASFAAYDKADGRGKQLMA